MRRTLSAPCALATGPGDRRHQHWSAVQKGDTREDKRARAGKGRVVREEFHQEKQMTAPFSEQAFAGKASFHLFKPQAPPTERGLCAPRTRQRQEDTRFSGESWSAARGDAAAVYTNEHHTNG